MMLSSLVPTVVSRGCLFAIFLCTLPLCLLAKETKVSVRFTNALKDDVPISMHWRNPTDRSEKQVTHRFRRGETEVVEAYVGHVFVAYDNNHEYFKEFYIKESKAGIAQMDIAVDTLIKKTAIARFINYGSESIEIFWKNTQTGDDVRVSPTLKKGEYFELDSHNGHKFVAKNMRGVVVEEFTVNSVPGVRETHTIGEKPKATFYNKMKKPMSIFWFNKESGQEVVVEETVEPGASHVVYAHPGHKFVVYDQLKRRSKHFTITADYGGKESFHVEL